MPRQKGPFFRPRPENQEKDGVSPAWFLPPLTRDFQAYERKELVVWDPPCLRVRGSPISWYSRVPACLRMEVLCHTRHLSEILPRLFSIWGHLPPRELPTPAQGPMQRPTGGHVAPTQRPARPTRSAVGDDLQAPMPERVLPPAPWHLAPRLEPRAVNELLP